MGLPLRSRIIKKSNETKVRVHKFIFYFFLQGSHNPQNYKFAPQIPEIITSAAQLPENNSPSPQLPQTPGAPSIYLKIKARSKAEARMPVLQHHMGFDARNLKEQYRHLSFVQSGQRLCGRKHC